MLIGALALSAFPFTSGYYSKDQILQLAYSTGHHDLWLAGLIGAFLTSLYTFRLIFVVFFGPERWRNATDASEPHAGHGSSHQIPLAVLAAFALIGGLIHPPLAAVLPGPTVVDEGSDWIARVPLIASFAGIGLAWLLFLQMPQLPAALATNAATAWIASLWRNAWGFDWIYDRVFVRPFVWLSRINRDDPIDRAMNLVPATLSGLNVLASATQNGNVRWYAAVAGAGLCVLIGVVAFT